MSLVNLAHVCSHLQNASLARLGLTSIPYTKLHLSLALLLHKQGFFSQVKLGGPAPPASCFPASISDNHRITAAPHRDRDPRSPEAALYDMVYRGWTEEQLRQERYPEDSIQFALEHRELSKAQLEKDGWDRKVVDFILEHGQKSPEELEQDGLSPEEQGILRKYSLNDALRIVQQQLVTETSDTTSDDMDLASEPVRQRVRRYLRRQGFDRETLAHFARTARFTTPRHLERDGITISAMGLEIENQHITTLPPQYRDPDHLEDEGIITQTNRASRRLWLGLKYWDGMPVLRKAQMVSKPTKRIWLDYRDLARVVRGGHAGQVKGMTKIGEVMAVTTDRGIMEARECVERRIGGMVLCRVS